MKMNFNIIRQDLLYYAEQFGVCQNPSNEKLIKRLIDDPPKNEEKAKEIFEYLSSQQGRFIFSDWKILADLKFIPVRDSLQPDIIIHASPNGCFFKTYKRRYNSLLIFFLSHLLFSDLTFLNVFTYNFFLACMNTSHILILEKRQIDFC
jgi:hypothetical protein